MIYVFSPDIDGSKQFIGEVSRTKDEDVRYVNMMYYRDGVLKDTTLEDPDPTICVDLALDDLESYTKIREVIAKQKSSYPGVVIYNTVHQPNHKTSRYTRSTLNKLEEIFGSCVPIKIESHAKGIQDCQKIRVDVDRTAKDPEHAYSVVLTS